MKPPKSVLTRKYLQRQWKETLLLFAGIGLVLICAVVFTCFGTADTDIDDVFSAVYAAVSGEGSPQNTHQKIVFYLRMPRIVMAILTGFGLAVSGAALQSITNNPLVSPFTLGISSAAAFGASLAIVFGITLLPGSAGIILNAFLFAILCALLVYLIAQKARMTPESIILTGIALNYLFTAAGAIVEFFANEHQLAAAVAWSFGSLNESTWQHAKIVFVFVTLGSIGIFLNSKALDTMASGSDDVAKSLGINPVRLRIIVGSIAVLITASIICFTGVIGFIGLAGPHIARLLAGNNYRILLPLSIIVGALLMLISDTAGRMLLSPVNIPVGIMVSFFGAPLFLNLILAGRKRRM